jgi:hypothetical protein
MLSRRFDCKYSKHPIIASESAFFVEMLLTWFDYRGKKNSAPWATEICTHKVTGFTTLGIRSPPDSHLHSSFFLASRRQPLESRSFKPHSRQNVWKPQNLQRIEGSFDLVIHKFLFLGMWLIYKEGIILISQHFGQTLILMTKRLEGKDKS